MVVFWICRHKTLYFVFAPALVTEADGIENVNPSEVTKRSLLGYVSVFSICASSFFGSLYGAGIGTDTASAYSNPVATTHTRHSVESVS